MYTLYYLTSMSKGITFFPVFFYEVYRNSGDSPVSLSTGLSFFLLSIMWQKNVEDSHFFGFLFIAIVSSGLKIFFDHFSGDPLEESVAGGELLLTLWTVSMDCRDFSLSSSRSGPRRVCGSICWSCRDVRHSVMDEHKPYSPVVNWPQGLARVLIFI